MSTIEIASQNADKLISEFKKYFDYANTNGVGEYKTYVVTETNGAKRKALQNFFDANGNRYGRTDASSVKG